MTPALSTYALQLEQLSRELLHSGVAFRPRLTEINERLTQLGQPPAEGQPAEPEIVTTERKNLIAEKAEINAILGVAEDLSIRINKQVAQITEIRRHLFHSLLTKRYGINYALIFEVTQAFETEMGDLYRSVASWLKFVGSFKLKSMLAATFFALAAAAVIVHRRATSLRSPLRSRPEGAGTVLSQPAFRCLLVDADADDRGRRLSRCYLLPVRLLRGPARRHRRNAVVVVLRHRDRLFRVPAGYGGAVAVAAELAPDPGREPGRALAGRAHRRRRPFSPASTIS